MPHFDSAMDPTQTRQANSLPDAAGYERIALATDSLMKTRRPQSGSESMTVHVGAAPTYLERSRRRNFVANGASRKASMARKGPFLVGEALSTALKQCGAS